ncbi:MAG: hypothetical protein COA74_03640 [Gammaproteobacteria bacterium]|nr:MAG: hypothetical protein COA74_03640 [Gammaproteobacteria bacterium]
MPADGTGLPFVPNHESMHGKTRTEIVKMSKEIRKKNELTRHCQLYNMKTIAVNNLFRLGRHVMKAKNYRIFYFFQ